MKGFVKFNLPGISCAPNLENVFKQNSSAISLD